MNVPKIFLTLTMFWLGVHLLTGCSDDQAAAPTISQREPLAQVQEPPPDQGQAGLGRLAFVRYNDTIQDRIGGGSTTSSYIYLRNIGDGDVTQIRADLSTLIETSFDFLYGTMPGDGDCLPDITLKRGEQCRFRVKFAAQGPESVSASMKILYHDGAALATVSAPIKGEGYDFDLGRLKEVNYGGVMTFSSRKTLTFELKNTGVAGSSAIRDIRVVSDLPSPFGYHNDDPFPGYFGTCFPTTVLASGEPCFVKVKFSPSEYGNYEGRLILSYSNGVSTQRINLVVKGTYSAPVPTPTPQQ